MRNHHLWHRLRFLISGNFLSMFRISAALVLAIWAATAGFAFAQIETIWNCKDPNGRTQLTNLKEDTVGKDCRIVQQQRVTVVPAGKAPAAKSPAGFATPRFRVHAA